MSVISDFRRQKMPQPRARFVVWCFCLLLTVYSSVTLNAQIADDEAALLLAQNRISIQTLTVFFAAYRRTANLDTEKRAQIDKIAADLRAAQQSGKFGETRRQLFKGFALMRGKPWTAKEEFAASLVLRPNSAIFDSNRPQLLSLGQVFPAQYNYQATPKLRITVAENSTQRRELSSPGKIVKEIGTYEGLSSDLADEPFAFEADLRGVKDGFYLLCAELMDGDATIRKIWTTVSVVQNLDSLKADIERRLSHIKNGSESTKASIRYPFEWARQINLGRREMPRGDFASEIDRSTKLLDSLEKGKDLLYQAIGDNKRHYYFAEANEIMPYRLYVPSNYDGRKKFPLIVALHGLGGTEDTFLNRYNGLMKKLAEENGYILIAPLGYRINGGYGRQTRNPPDSQRRRILDLSEKDVMNVVRKMREEYKIDDKRLFLMGHSMGGTGTWTLGAKYAEMWAALAPIAPGYIPDEDVSDLSRLKEMPILISHGSKDTTAPPELSRRTVAELKKLNINPEFLEIPDADHETIVPTILPKIFEFFNRQKKPEKIANTSAV
jgi:predicted esterase